MEHSETPNPIICLRNYPESLFKVISDKKAEMIKQKKRHVSFEMVVITMLKESIEGKGVTLPNGESCYTNKHSGDHRQDHQKKGQ